MLIINEEETKKEEVVSEKEETKELTKVEHLISLIKSKPNGKFLIFSNYDDTFTQITDTLDDNKIKYAKLYGSSAHIRLVMKDFDDGMANVLLLNSRHYGSGFNLNKASDIVIFHKLDVNTERQVVGRAQRIGRDCTLNITYLYYKHE
jgi:SNF2 family DNA or RNA helicase